MFKESIVIDNHGDDDLIFVKVNHREQWEYILKHKHILPAWYDVILDAFAMVDDVGMSSGRKLKGVNDPHEL
ncbi:hypothetical protein BLOT_002633 [Blomia tropicalis]|nr:hypothetical protein BLOT_002633 [Blomia tropicalis]